MCHIIYPIHPLPCSYPVPSGVLKDAALSPVLEGDCQLFLHETAQKRYLFLCFRQQNPLGWTSPHLKVEPVDAELPACHWFNVNLLWGYSSPMPDASSILRTYHQHSGAEIQ